MLRMRIELVPFGREEERMTLATMLVSNVGGGSHTGSYAVEFTSDKDGERTCVIPAFPRTRLHAVHLIARALKQLGYVYPKSGRHCGSGRLAMADVRSVARLLGGSRVLKRHIRTAMDLHEVLERGLPLQSLQFFAENRRHFAADIVLAFVLGRRRKAHPWSPVRLGRHQTDRLFVLADALANAADVFRSMRKAEKWLAAPLETAEIGGLRPMDLLSTPVGEKIVAHEIREGSLR